MLSSNDLKNRMRNRNVEDSKNGQSYHKKIETIVNFKIPSKHHNYVSKTTQKRYNCKENNMAFSKNASAEIRENGSIFTRGQLLLSNNWPSCVKQSQKHLQMQTI